MSQSIDSAVGLLDMAGVGLDGHRGLVGLDGFIDQIIRVVEHVDGPGTRSFFRDIASLAERIRRATGKSTALELAIQQVKLGGNGPIMANALASMGLELTYIGAVGQGGALHPIFECMREHSTVLPVCDVARTDALEFNDGKLMLQQMDCLQNLDYNAIVQALGIDCVRDLFDAADFVALNHWSSLPHMMEIWRRLQQDICPTLQQRKRTIFFDLGDPEKRSAADIREALQTIADFGTWYETILGLNLKESETICEAMGCEPSGCIDEKDLVRARAAAIRDTCAIDCVMIHPLAFAIAADANGIFCVDGPFTPNPRISTGAGDHLNSGFCLGKVLGGDTKLCLQIGVATSGYYVRKAASPSLPELRSFLIELKNELPE